jgi:ribokinase
MGRVFVAGSINMDVVATADRHPRIGETVAGKAVLYFPGGKGANQAVAAVKLGAPTTLIGRIGQDAFGNELKAFLAAEGIDLSFVRETNEAHTGTAIITLAHADNTIVVVPGANALVSDADVTTPRLSNGDVAVSQFEIPLPAIRAFFQRARAKGATTILNPAPAIAFDAEMLDLVSSSSMRPNSACWQKPSFATPTTTPVSLKQHDRCRPAAAKSSASPWANAACWRWSTASP